MEVCIGMSEADRTYVRVWGVCVDTVTECDTHWKWIDVGSH